MKEELIAAVHSVPVLWDKFHKQHHNRYVLEKEWKRIASQLGTTDKNIRQIWKNLRQEFGKQLKKTLKSGSAAPDEPTSTWPYFESMLFLTDQFLPRKSSGNLTSTLELSALGGNEEEMVYNEDNPDIPDADKSVTESQPGSSTSNDGPQNNNEEIGKGSKQTNSVVTKTGYIKRITPQVVIGQQLLDVEREKLKIKQNKVSENPNDEDIGFFNSLLPHVRQLTPRDKLRFRMQVQNILFDMAYPQQQSTSSFTPPSPVYDDQNTPNSSHSRNSQAYYSDFVETEQAEYECVQHSSEKGFTKL